MIETVERRVLGALRWLDAVTGSPVTRPLRVDWTLRDARLGSQVAPENIPTTPLALEAGGRYSLTFTVKP